MVTFLFTDVEGSTRRWEADADEMRIALAAHDEVLRGAIEGHGGWLFKHTGDGVCAAFASPRLAVDAAVAAQRALELPVRMGTATGEAELREGDYFGAVLNRAARVMAAGHGGQILLADSTAGLLSGVDLVDLGPRRLRDLPAPVQVFQVRAEGLRTDFPALRALDASPGNLRAATTSLIGRESEVAELHAAVKAHRLVTLTGVGGVGKTRLATEVAARLADEFPDGVWFFELAAVTDPAAVPDAVAAVLGITQQPGKTVTESVASALEGRYHSLVLLLGVGGVRWGEAAALRVSDVDFLRRRITLHTNAVRVGRDFAVGSLKSTKSRTVVLPAFVIDALAATCQGKGRDELLWPSATGGYLAPPSSHDSWLSGGVGRCRKADKTFPRVTAHGLRHTAACLAISAGANPKVVQRMLGHASAAMTLDVYADLFDSDLDEVAVTVSKLWPRQANQPVCSTPKTP